MPFHAFHGLNPTLVPNPSSKLPPRFFVAVPRGGLTYNSIPNFLNLNRKASCG